MDTLKRGNKENKCPKTGPKNVSSVMRKKKDGLQTDLLQPKNGQKQSDLPKKKPSGQEVARPGVEVVPKERKTLTQAFRTQQSTRHAKLVAEAPKPTSTAPPKPLPGTYKGRIIQSKIACCWKPSDVLMTQINTNPPNLKNNVNKSKSMSDLTFKSSNVPSRNQGHRPKSVSETPCHTIRTVHGQTVQQGGSKTVKHSVTFQLSATSSAPLSKPKMGPVARPITRKIPAPARTKEPTHGNKPKPIVPAREKKSVKPITSIQSQYRVSVESADERRAKLAEWLAAKGKVLKRPPISEQLPTQRSSMKSRVNQDHASVPKTTAAHGADVQHVPEGRPENDQALGEKLSCPNHTPSLATSHDDESDEMEDVVRNLCNALEAMEIPSTCNNQAICEEEEDSANKDYRQDDMTKMENGPKECSESETDADENNKTEFDDHTQSEDESDYADEMCHSPVEGAGASVVKYSVKTTPFLQSVKKRIEGEVGLGSGSRRKSSIKDLKFLTPVRRSSRIQRKLSRLPDMLTDHDPCISSLAELVQLDEEANAYIYRKNPALLDDLPDQPRDLERL
ncbi:cytoskeleton-associated protein 2 [Denticeps clupeoides]|uniref:cytoskeleton-associated protein 2 n=1 Tax=Denticeps clupeoides TaxID=299321 RepID=UPI0010A47F80|nr:cytoskeleton-associated protein 2-like [Denticeps clupeoides]